MHASRISVRPSRGPAAASLDLVVTGVVGHCPLYRKLGYTPQSLRRTT